MAQSCDFPEVITIDAKKCTNCHACVGVCPVKYCNNASDADAGIAVNPRLCIACGACLRACTHQARSYVDDTDRFFADLARGERIGVLVAPAVAVSFPGQLERLLGYLRSERVAMCFDVSLGAEIATRQYVRVLERGAKRPIIAQPCPAVVGYIETYRPRLRPYLAPTSSPTMAMAAWVKARHPDLKLAFISPCIAKKHEFEDPNTHGRVQYNVTIARLKDRLAQQGLDLARCAPARFDGPVDAERALLFSQPGGLHATFKRYGLALPNHAVRRVEGPEVYEEFFDELEQEIASGTSDVVLIDVLNCTHGCNRGTGTVYSERTTAADLRYQDELLDKRWPPGGASTKQLEALNRFLDESEHLDLSRAYVDRSGAFAALQEPTAEMRQALREAMGKLTDKDIKNCQACGYRTCDAMAKAILNGLYRPEQCHHFLEQHYRATQQAAASGARCRKARGGAAR